MNAPAHTDPVVQAVYLDAQLAWKAGLSPVPSIPGQKRPVESWAEHQAKRPSPAPLKRWYPGMTTLGVVCGPKPDDPDPVIAALPGIEVIDFDDPATYDAVLSQLADVGLEVLVARIEAGYAERTPRGGMHWIYRCAEVPGNTKIAQRRGDDGTVTVLVETRGTGGYCRTAPTEGYSRVSGGFDTIATITVDERTRLMAYLATFDAPTAAQAEAPHASGQGRSGVRETAEQFNATHSWADVLTPAGWTHMYTRRDGVDCWRRPGKDTPQEISATTGYKGADVLKVFSTSTLFETTKAYSKFAAHTLLTEGGTAPEHFREAAKKLAGGSTAGPARRAKPATPDEEDVGRAPADDDARDDDEKPKKSFATQIVELVRDTGVELWHETDSGDGYLTLAEHGHLETYPIRSRVAKDWLARLCYQRLERVPGAQAIADAVAVLEADARHDGIGHDVAVRVAAHEGHIYVDLCTPDWLVLDIGPTGWQVITQAPVRFRRARNARPLPVPVAGGTLAPLRELLNVEGDREWHLLVGWLVGTLAPRGPYPVLALTGEQGTAKSTTARLLRKLVDPHRALLQGAVRNFDDLAVALRHQHVLGIDNLSTISMQLSDELARVATGGGNVKRQLYTDDDVVVSDVCRPILLTSIPLVIEGGDLLERAIIVRCPVIDETARRTESDVWDAFDRLHPSLLGALADAVSVALRHHGEVRLTRRPRMADHVEFVTAAAPAFGWTAETYLDAFTGQQRDAIRQQVEDDPIAAKLLAFIDAQPGQRWAGTTAALLAALTPPKPDKAPDGWPKNPRSFRAHLDRLAPSLRGLKLHMTPPDRHSKSREWNIGRKTGTTGTTGTTTGNAAENAASAGAGPTDDRHQTGTRPAPTGTSPAERPAPNAETGTRPAPRPAPRNQRESNGLAADAPAGAGRAGSAGLSQHRDPTQTEVPVVAIF
jgi:hypothetical protein